MTKLLVPNYHFYDYHSEPENFCGEVIAGLQAQQKFIAPKFFYDTAGSQLFDRICALPEYYQTRVEMQILADNGAEIASCIGHSCLLVEPGSGSSQKIRRLLDNVRPRAYLPVDISREHLIQTVKKLYSDYPWLEVHAICADFTKPLTLPWLPDSSHTVVFFPGSSIGNFEPDETLDFLRNTAALVGEKGGLLIGIDLQNDSRILHAAYNDTQGVTARFNRNLLTRINRELGGNFQTDLFEHHAFYNQQQHRIEMHLISKIEQHVNINDHSFRFEQGESIHTENSYKYTPDSFQTYATAAGFTPVRHWTDSEQRFCVQYLEVTR